MADVDDLYEAGDREPGEPESELLNPEELIEAIDDPQARETVEALLADVRYLRGLEKREEWAITKTCDVAPPPHAYHYPRKDAAVRAAERHGQQAWRRELIVFPWEPISPDAPL